MMEPFPVHEPHCIETQFTHLPSKEQKQQLSKLDVHVMYKKFTSSDDSHLYKLEEIQEGLKRRSY